VDYKQVIYSRKNESWFEVKVDDKKMMIVADSWERFLDQYGTNPKHNEKRIAGMDSVDKQALTDFLAKIK
jgi:hypothetical protein